MYLLFPDGEPRSVRRIECEVTPHRSSIGGQIIDRPILSNVGLSAVVTNVTAIVTTVTSVVVVTTAPHATRIAQ